MDCERKVASAIVHAVRPRGIALWDLLILINPTAAISTAVAVGLPHGPVFALLCAIASLPLAAGSTYALWRVGDALYRRRSPRLWVAYALAGVFITAGPVAAAFLVSWLSRFT